MIGKKVHKYLNTLLSLKVQTFREDSQSSNSFESQLVFFLMGKSYIE